MISIFNDVMGVTALTLSVCMSVCLCVHLTLSDRHTDLNFGMEVKRKDIYVRFVD